VSLVDNNTADPETTPENWAVLADNTVIPDPYEPPPLPPAPVSDLSRTLQPIQRTGYEWPLALTPDLNWQPLPTDNVTVDITLPAPAWCLIDFHLQVEDASTLGDTSGVWATVKLSGGTVHNPGPNSATWSDYVLTYLNRLEQPKKGYLHGTMIKHFGLGLTTATLMATLTNSSTGGVTVNCTFAELTVAPYLNT
jgi:hypothetical protein